MRWNSLSVCRHSSCTNPFSLSSAKRYCTFCDGLSQSPLMNTPRSLSPLLSPGPLQRPSQVALHRSSLYRVDTLRLWLDTSVFHRSPQMVHISNGLEATSMTLRAQSVRHLHGSSALFAPCQGSCAELSLPRLPGRDLAACRGGLGAGGMGHGGPGGRLDREGLRFLLL